MQGFFTKKFNEESIKKPPRTDMSLLICKVIFEKWWLFYVLIFLILNFLLV